MDDVTGLPTGKQNLLAVNISNPYPCVLNYGKVASGEWSVANQSLYYEDLWYLFQSFLFSLENFKLEWDWPDWLNLDAIKEFCENFPDGALEMIDRAITYVLSLVMYLDYDLEHGYLEIWEPCCSACALCKDLRSSP